MNPSIHDLAREAEWEMEGVRRGVLLYEKAAKVADPTSLPPGQALMRGMVGPLSKTIIAARDKALDSIGAPGRKPTYVWPLTVLDPLEAAVITLTSAVRGVSGRTSATTKTDTITAISRTISEGLRDQLQHNRWAAQQKTTNAEAKKLETEGHKNLILALKRRYPNVTQVVWRSWVAKLEVAEVEEWEEKEWLPLGGLLIRLLCQAAPDRFELGARPANGGVQHVLVISPTVAELMADIEQRAMVARPRLMPMICPPIPWTY